MLNQGGQRFKQSRVEKTVNMICVYLIIFKLILCLIMAIFSGYFTSNYATLQENNIRRRAEYLFYNGSQEEAEGEKISYYPAIEGLRTFATYFILLNTLIPISLVVSLEFVKAI